MNATKSLSAQLYEIDQKLYNLSLVEPLLNSKKSIASYWKARFKLISNKHYILESHPKSFLKV